MTNEVTEKKTNNLQASLDKRGIKQEDFRVIKEILYPNVQKDETLLMALDYCRARKLDIMKRSIQIVPIWDSKTKSMKDTIWPSISEVRITAHRTGQYAGISEAEFGEDVTENLGGVNITYPKWCKITVFKLVGGEARPFSAKLFWKQEYKTAKNDTTAPNSMWGKRTHSQLEKCTEAAALRKAFPEELGNDYIAEEAFDANEAMLNVTPVSKTANAHVPPKALEESFATKIDIKEESQLVESQEHQEIDVQNFAVEDENDAIFDKIESDLRKMKNAHAINGLLERSYKNELDKMKEMRPDLYEELILIKNKCMEAFNDK